MFSQPNAIPSTGRELIQSAPPIGNATCFRPIADPTDVFEDAPGDPSLRNASVDARTAVADGCEAEERASIAASHLPADRASNNVEDERRYPEEVGHETNNGPQVNATDQAPEHVDESSLALQPRASRAESAQPYAQVEHGGVSDFNALEIQTASSADEQDHEDPSGVSFAEKGASASPGKVGAPHVGPTTHVAKHDSSHHPGIPETGVAVAASVDLGLSMPAEVCEPAVLLSSQGENANHEGDLGSSGSLLDAQCASKKMIKSDRDRLHILWKLIEKTGLPLNKVPLTVRFLEEQIDRFGLHGRPLTYARSILISFDRLVKIHPTLQSLEYEMVEDMRVHSLPKSERPTSFCHDLDKWKQAVPVKVPGKQNATGSLTAGTIKDYVSAAVSALSALRLSGVRFSDESGLSFLLRVPAVTIWEKFLSERQKPKTVQATLAAMLRIARDTHIEQSCIDFLEARLTAVMTSTEIDTARLAGLAEPENYLALIEVPELLMLKAEDPDRHMFSRLSAGRSAVAFQLMWEHPDLPERFIADFNLQTHVRGAGSELTLLRSENDKPEQLASATAQLISRLLKVNELLSVSSSYLLPGKLGQPRATGSAMELVYHQIQSVLFRHVTRSDLRDLNTFIALSADEADLGAIAAGAGYKNSKSLALRLGHSAGRPKQERNK